MENNGKDLAQFIKDNELENLSIEEVLSKFYYEQMVKFKVGDKVYTYHYEIFNMDKLQFSFIPIREQYTVKDIKFSLYNIGKADIWYTVSKDGNNLLQKSGEVFLTLEECIQWCNEHNKLF